MATLQDPFHFARALQSTFWCQSEQGSPESTDRPKIVAEPFAVSAVADEPDSGETCC